MTSCEGWLDVGGEIWKLTYLIQFPGEYRMLGGQMDNGRILVLKKM